MDLSFDECRAVLEQFREIHALFLMRSEVHGIQVNVDDGEPTLVVSLTLPLPDSSLAADEKVPARFSYEYNGRKSAIPIKFLVRPIPTAHAGKKTTLRTTRGNAPSRSPISEKDDAELDLVAGPTAQPGDAAWGAGLGGFGTLGWNIQLNGVVVCLSNWHVFCADGNATPLGADIFIAGQRQATLHAFQPLRDRGNTWDYALGKYIDPVSAAGIMRQCDDGTTLPYPVGLSPRESVKPGGNTTYHKVGARPPTCRTGRLRAVGHRKIDYDGRIRWFDSQLIFSKMTDRGDSGAVIVRETDNTVTGLNFAGDDEETIANPIFAANWERTGIVRFDGQLEIPMFIGNEVPTFPALETKEPLLAPLGSPRIADRAVVAQFQNTAIPPMHAGKLFMGVAVKDAGRWTIPPPPPPVGMSMETVLVRVETRQVLVRAGGRGAPLYETFSIEHFLCFA